MGGCWANTHNVTNANLLMFTPFERLVAFRYLRARRQEGFISVIAWFSFIGIALGVATLIIVMSVMGGFRQELLGRILGLNGHIGAYGTAAAISDYQALAQRLRQVPGVVSATPIVEGQALASSPSGGASGVLVRGMAPEDMRARGIIARNIVAGTLDDFRGDDAILVGTRLANRFNLGPGDRLTLVSPQGTPRPSARCPASAPTGSRRSSMWACTNTTTASSSCRSTLPRSISSCRARPPRSRFLRPIPMKRAASGRAIIRAMPDAPLRLTDWTQSNSAFFAAVQVERNVMFLILSLIILVAAFNIISSLIMLVKDKGRAIAVLRTMGAARGSILRIFLMCGAAIGVIGTLLGFGLGVAFTLNIEAIREAVQTLLGTQVFQAEIYFLTRLPAVLNWTEVLQVLAMALTLSLLATIYPAWRAASLDPVEALRGE